VSTEAAVAFGGLGLAVGYLLWAKHKSGSQHQLTYHMLAQGDTQVNLGVPHGVAGPGVFIYGPTRNHQVEQASGLL
jgi:hypothetical protein